MAKVDGTANQTEEMLLMAESIDRYREELRDAQARNRELEFTLSQWDGYKKASHVIGLVGIVLLCVGAFYGVGFLVYKNITAPSDSTVCHIKRHGSSGACPIVQYSLYKVRDWRGDVGLGYYSTLEEASEEATRLGCLTTNANISR